MVDGVLWQPGYTSWWIWPGGVLEASCRRAMLVPVNRRQVGTARPRPH
jgi:hypothetical protein